jgi:hypothetical protein
LNLPNLMLQEEKIIYTEIVKIKSWCYTSKKNEIMKVYLTLIVLITLYNILNISYIMENINTQHGGITSIHKIWLYYLHMLRDHKLGKAGACLWQINMKYMKCSLNKMPLKNLHNLMLREKNSNTLAWQK